MDTAGAIPDAQRLEEDTSPPRTMPTMVAPAVATPVIDTHAHVFDTRRFPFDSSATYDLLPNEHGSPLQYQAVLDSQGVAHAVLINPLGGYGTDNRCMLDAIQSSHGRFKGVAVVPPDLTESRALQLAQAGVVGVRYSLHHPAGPRLAEAGRVMEIASEIGWSVLVHCIGDLLVEALPLLRKCRARIIVDHCGRPEVTRGLAQPGFRALLELAGDGTSVVKLSGVFRFSREPWPHCDVEPYVQALVDAFGTERCLWASDWPFTRMDQRVDYGPLLMLAARWFPSLQQRQAVLSGNAARLFGFPLLLETAPC